MWPPRSRGSRPAPTRHPQRRSCTLARNCRRHSASGRVWNVGSGSVWFSFPAPPPGSVNETDGTVSGALLGQGKLLFNSIPSQPRRFIPAAGASLCAARVGGLVISKAMFHFATQPPNPRSCCARVDVRQCGFTQFRPLMLTIAAVHPFPENWLPVALALGCRRVLPKWEWRWVGPQAKLGVPWFRRRRPPVDA